MFFHPRPSPIAAAMYQLRDLGVEAIILHGPSGCCFRTARLLEMDNVRVFTTSLNEDSIIFGGKENLERTLDYVIDKGYKFIGLVGTCASMIIGENLWDYVNYRNTTIVPVEVHSGLGDNTIGAIKVMESALKLGLIDEEEFERQKFLLKKATEVEKKRGMAKREYIKPSYDDDLKEALEVLRDAKKIACVLNAKKETAYLFTHPLIVLNKYFDCVNIANLSTERGLKKIREDAKNILKRFKPDYITGSLDEYPIAGEKAVKILKELDVDVIVVSGVPHALPVEELGKDVIKIAISDGPRTYYPIKELYDYAVIELDAHAKVLGKRDIVRSRFGESLELFIG
ncbi:Ni-sirohydrochlorin a,c-diamide reductive cyclase catalytic subunit [Methanocaldococcus infernus]|uniref:Methanogenesis marker 13 metalloprotein n=1 Tax=Methanocaldococcus infernus (strain DSM 11812 / JCM 15783 / ME) TaxID=573063 RepID=D5VRN7_METIM|nr:Ni-sirohydrochlorin a,c-diamide reductive cyclase catalytic subunit [Methanocaldococcus infernus]ADG13240.1 methanogenesis marker 13 metalloprotein [Methanocaldococcus infernus ME]